MNIFFCLNLLLKSLHLLILLFTICSEMLSNTISVEIADTNGPNLKIINQEKPVNTHLSSILKVVQTDVNNILTDLVNKDGGDVKDFPDSGIVSNKFH